MRRIANHPLTKIFIGWLFVLTVWLILPADAPYVDQAMHRSRT